MPEEIPASIPKDALAFFRAKDLRVGFDAEDVATEEHAHGFTVAKAVKLDVLDDIRAGLDEALAEGQTFRDFAKSVKPKLQAKGWWGIKEEIDPATGERREVQLGSPRRLKTIYRANMRSARAAGQWARIERNRESHPFLLYELGPSREHRDEHLKWAGTLLPVDHSWWSAHMPPNGYGCKCRVRAVSRGEAERLQRNGIQDPQAAQEINPETGLPTGRRVGEQVPVRTEAPAIEPVTYTNRRTGEQRQVDAGLHPSWASNPGQQRAATLRGELTDRMTRADGQTARASARQVVDSPILEQWLADAQAGRNAGELPGGVLDGEVATAIGASSSLVRLGREIATQAPTAATLRRLPALLDGGELIRRGDGRLLAYQQQSDGWWRAVLATGNDGALRLNALERVNDATHEDDLADGHAIRRET